jgi:hypothetical protein
MRFGVFDHLDRNDLVLHEYYGSRLSIIEESYWKLLEIAAQSAGEVTASAGNQENSSIEET